MRRIEVLWFLAIAACSQPATPAASPADAATAEPDAAGTDAAAPEAGTSADGAPGDAADAAPDAGDTEEAPLARAVDPLIGTSFGGGNIGSAYPAATRPWGLCKVGPDTQNAGGANGTLHCGGYQYMDPYIYGFSHNHLEGTGAGDYGNLAVMPFASIDAAATTRKGRNSTFSHATEVAEAGYYAVSLDKPKVRAEMTATTRCAHHRYTFAEAPAGGGVLIDLATSIADGKTGAGKVELDATTQSVRGTIRNIGAFSDRYGGFPVFFEARFDRKWTSAGVWNDGVIQPGVEATATTALPSNIGAWATFDLGQKPVVELQLCLSYVSADGAKLALLAELPTWNFEATRHDALLAWQKALQIIEIQAPSATELTLFYSALYRVMQMPTIWNDVDFSYRGFDDQVHKTDGWNYVTDLSLWDTFRTENPLIVLLWPTMARDTLRSLAAMTAQGKHPPQWAMGMGDTGSMIGYHAASLAADAVVKGVVDFDAATLYVGLAKQASAEGSNLECMNDFVQRGYCAAESAKGSVSLTAEYAYDAACMATLASHLGETAAAATYAAQAGNYKALWDPGTQFFRAKTGLGAWTEPFAPEFWNFSNAEYVEGSAWQWNWFVPHDTAGLRALYPSDAAFVAKLEAFFQNAKDGFNFYFPSGFYFQGNEPDILASVLFSAAGRPDLSDTWTRWIADSCYTTAPDGLVGNDDAGTLSAWYVLAAIGLMPRPGLPGYDLVAPRYDAITLHLAGGDVQIAAAGAWGGGLVGGSVQLGATAVAGRWLEHKLLVAGAKLSWLAKGK